MDVELEDDWLERLNSLPLEICSVCAGHPGQGTPNSGGGTESPGFVCRMRTFEEARRMQVLLAPVATVGRVSTWSGPHDNWVMYVDGKPRTRTFRQEDFAKYPLEGASRHSLEVSGPSDPDQKAAWWELILTTLGV